MGKTLSAIFTDIKKLNWKKLELTKAEGLKRAIRMLPTKEGGTIPVIFNETTAYILRDDLGIFDFDEIIGIVQNTSAGDSIDLQDPETMEESVILVEHMRDVDAPEVPTMVYVSEEAFALFADTNSIADIKDTLDALAPLTETTDALSM